MTLRSAKDKNYIKQEKNTDKLEVWKRSASNKSIIKTLEGGVRKIIITTNNGNGIKVTEHEIKTNKNFSFFITESVFYGTISKQMK